MPWLVPGPAPRPTDWLEWVNPPQTEGALARLRHSVNCVTPFGGDGCVRQTAAWLGLESTLRPSGRPQKSQNKDELESVNSLF